MIENEQNDVVVTDAGGSTVYYGGQAGVYLTAYPPWIGVWGGSFAPGFQSFQYGESYTLQGNPSLGDSGTFWYFASFGPGGPDLPYPGQFIFVI
jgi:hypothetical protein